MITAQRNKLQQYVTNKNTQSRSQEGTNEYHPTIPFLDVAKPKKWHLIHK